MEQEERQQEFTASFDNALKQTIDELKASLEDLPFVLVDENARQRLELPKGLGWVEFRPLSGTEIDEFEERRIRSVWRQNRQADGAIEMEVVADWASAIIYLFKTAITDFEIKVRDDYVVKYSDFKRHADAINFLAKLHWKLQRYIGLHILKVSGWEPPARPF